MSQNITKNILENILKLYEKTCAIKSNNFNKLFSLKKTYYDLFKKCKNFNQLDTYKETNDIDFLERELSDNFIEEIKKLEKVLYLKITDFFIGYSINKNLRDYYQSRFFYSLKKFHNFYYNQNILEKDLELEKAIILELKEVLPIDYKISNDFKKSLISSITQQLKIYKNIIDKDFFDIRNLFRFYNKEIRIYINSIHIDKDIIDIAVYAYSSDKDSIYIYPNKITVLPSLDLNVEEINKKADFTLRIISSEKYFKMINLLRITDNSPLEEVVNLFWRSASRDEQLEFLRYFYELLGYELKHSQHSEIFYLDKIQFENINKKNKKNGEKRLFFLPNKTYFDSTDLIKKFHSLNSKNILDKDSFITLFSFNYINLKNIKLINNNISVITLNDITSILAKLRLVNLFNKYFKKKILEKNPSELKLIIQNEIKGERLLEDLTGFDIAKGTWQQFEELGENVFDFLFKDSFKAYTKRKQYVDYNGHRRYDLLIVNINPKVEFWKNCKTEYDSKIIIIDFKNYNKTINQDIVHIFSKYLNQKKGSFGILVSKSEINESGQREQKIKYFDDNKLIIHLSLRDLCKMVNYKMKNQNPEDILDEKVINIIINGEQT